MSSSTLDKTPSQSASISTLIPARIDRLPWSRFHTRVVASLGVAWVLDGLEITFASNMTTNLSDKASLGLSSRAASDIASVYLVGEVVGALVFGRLSDRLGRKNLFVITLGLYLLANGLAAASWGLYSIDVFRFFAGMGIGGEYAAINSAIDELIPSKHRGRVDILVNGTYWGGAALAAFAGVWLLNPADVPIDWGWRIALLIGPALGAVVWYVRRTLPESPRWLITHGREKEAEAAVKEIEDWVASTGHDLSDVDDSKAIEIDPSKSSPSLWTVTRTLVATYPKRTVLGAVLMITQSFLYNAIFFTYAQVLTTFFHVGAGDTSYYYIAFAVGNLLGPVALGPLFDSLGRRVMISGTYLVAAVLLAVTAVAFDHGLLSAGTQTLCWCVIFFLASAGASSAYLTVSEIFPMELRAQAIAVFFSVAQGFGALGPAVYGGFVATGKPHDLMLGYLLGAGVMAVGGLTELFLGVNAERTSLEDVVNPLTVVGKPSGGVSAATA
ncbi:MFS transporter [Jatrophihabitans endophyticus]|uniref:MFS transporter n=1 Tax=Jatrophihabitans endophyticus TaxID=1206085 RepID=UPI0019E38B2F|nr:MFS transporter [Jatrophihabitans endophyticus]MBE7187562.1 MFS transporter [Jatrophihabitans endophyticus]